MALRIAHGAFSCVRRELSARPAAARLLASRSCQGADEPPCPPCEPQPRPPCRATPRTTLRATRRVCCPPPAGNPPPCPPPPCTPPLTCQDVRSKKQGLKRMCSTAEGCGTDRDRVARRLSLAERERRLDYEREVAARPVVYASEPPPAPYTLGAERECARATDGREYALKCERMPPAPCGPDRTPPPPRCVELVRDTECSIRSNAHLDPCAHVPRTIIDIDRSVNRAAATHHEPTYPASRPSASTPYACTPSTSTPASQSSPAKNLTSRIMERLSLNRNSSASATCPKRSYEPKCETTGARRAGDTNWCQTQPKPPAVPPCCREPTTMEKIKRRGPTHCARQKEGGSGKRCFHSSASSQAATPAACESNKKSPDASIATAKGTADAESLKKVLKERDSLQEAGRGRIVGEIRKAAQNTTTGKLDIPVPSGAQNVRIHVSLDGAPPCCKTKSEPETARVNCSSVPDGTGANLNKNEPWLSLKNLHKKLASCRKNDSMKIVKDKKHDSGQTPGTCPRPQPTRPKSPAPRNPCSTPPAAPRGDPCVAPSPPKPRNPCASPAPAKPRSPCASPAPATPRNPCSKPAPSAPSAPPRRTCPTHGKPDPLKPKRFSIATDSDSLIAETLFIKW